MSWQQNSPLPEEKYPWLKEETSSQFHSSEACYNYGKCTIQLTLSWASTNLRPVKLYEWRPTFPDNAERPAAYIIL